MHRETDPGVADWRCHLMAARCANGECRATGPFVREYEYMGEGSAFEAALAAWNRRVDPLARLEAWRGEGEGRRYEVVSPVSPIGPDRLTPNGGWCVNLLTGGSTIRGRFTRSRWGDTLSEAVEVATKEVEG
jgi:hypothetical protein